ncbi:hypothetical protein AXG93_763s1090 [Marchantia polymorpha subsp. ruderalis]|uniref:Uncharacterized protein n=1 Tax=Marchantia polymorpha subsp. ruderalis TaxID=1480154 RepID=A0A176WS11_MARPO|nr:hypothetical protein AXG93_763s1090 [Marchantia polymorpha subsp. ruderalis]
MIAALGLEPSVAIALVYPSIVRVDGVLASESGRSGRSLQNLQCCKLSSKVGPGYGLDIGDDRNSDLGKSRKGVDKIRCYENCHHHHHSPDGGEGYGEPSEECSFKQAKPSSDCSKPCKEVCEPSSSSSSPSSSSEADQVLLFSLSLVSSLALWLYGVSRFKSKPIVVLCVVKGQKNLAALIRSQRKSASPAFVTVNHSDNVFLCPLPVLSFLTICLFSLSQYVIEPRTCALSIEGGEKSCCIRALDDFLKTLFAKLSSRIFKEVPAELFYQCITSMIQDESKADEPFSEAKPAP